MQRKASGARVVIVWLVALVFATTARAAGVDVNFRSPTREYVTAASDANPIWVEKELHDRNPQLEAKALERLRKVLAQIKASVPPVEKLWGVHP